MKRRPPGADTRRARALGNNIRGVTTNKRGRLVQFESEQERKLILLLERDATVIDFASQPEQLDFLDAQGRAHRYTPDFKVWRADKRIELHEVTVEARRDACALLRLREAAATEICRVRGWRFVTHTDLTLPAGQLYANLDFLSAFRGNAHLTDDVRIWWLNHLSACLPASPADVLARHAHDQARGSLLNGLYHLLWHDHIHMDWQQTLIWRGQFHPAACVWLQTPLKAVRS